eukprot:5550317-Amphidinium_carterae.1
MLCGRKPHCQKTAYRLETTRTIAQPALEYCFVDNILEDNIRPLDSLQYSVLFAFSFGVPNGEHPHTHSLECLDQAFVRLKYYEVRPRDDIGMSREQTFRIECEESCRWAQLAGMCQGCFLEPDLFSMRSNGVKS